MLNLTNKEIQLIVLTISAWAQYPSTMTPVSRIFHTIKYINDDPSEEVVPAHTMAAIQEMLSSPDKDIGDILSTLISTVNKDKIGECK